MDEGKRVLTGVGIMFFKRIKKSIIFITLVIGMCLFFWSVGQSKEVKNRYLNLQLFTKVLNLVQKYYVTEVDTQKLIYGAIKGMLKELDPHTNFLPPDIFSEFESETSGKFGGLGIEITIKDEVLTVISPIEDTPAYKAGILAGDRVVAIDGTSTKGLTLVETAQMMRGKKGTKVILSIYREGLKTPKDYTIKRAVVKIKSAKYIDLEGGYMYLRITSFMDDTADEVKRSIEKHEKGRVPLKGLVLDVRRNPGGLFDQAIKVSDLFLDKGVIVSALGRDAKKKEVFYAKKKGSRTDFPIILLIDEYSASSSEILAGALRDNKRSIIMGRRSFGKGSVQSVVKLGDGSGLKLTVARYLTPSGISIQAEGIKPDIVLDDMDPEMLEKAKVKKKARREQNIKGHLASSKEKKAKIKKTKSVKNSKRPQETFQLWWKADNKKSKKKLSKKDKLLSTDYQALQAYNYLRGWTVMKSF